MKLEDLDEDTRKKIENNQRYITTEIDLREFGYIFAQRRNQKIKWMKYTPKLRIFKTIEERIKEKQKFIKTNRDLSKFDYIKAGHSEGIQVWINKMHSIKISEEKYIEYIKQIEEYRKKFNESEKGKRYYRSYYLNHKKSYAIRGKKWKENHKEESKEYIRRYRKTPKGKLQSKKDWYKRYNRGFILLFKLKNTNDIKIEYHHVNKNLPYVIPVPIKIHKSIHGTNPNHYLGVTAKFYKWLEANPKIQIIDEIR